MIYLSTIGDILLPLDYRQTNPVPVEDYVARHPETHLGTATN